MKKIVSILISMVLCVSLFSIIAFAETKIDYPDRNASLENIAGETDRLICENYDAIGRQISIYFEYDADRFPSIDNFIEYTNQNYTPYLRTVFANNLYGKDYITVSGTQAVSKILGEVQSYYYVVTLTVNSNPALRKEMDRLVNLLEGQTARQQINYLYNYLILHVQYDSEIMMESGTETTLLKYKAVCMGYSRAMMELCRRLKIPCLGVINDTHMWNCVYLEGKWNMIDVTQHIYLCDKISDSGHAYNPAELAWGQKYYSDKTEYMGHSKAAYFTDLTQKWYINAIEYGLGRNLFNGVSDTKFAPSGNMTRGMFVTVLGRLGGVQADHSVTVFEDVGKNKYYTGYVTWAAQTGIVNGTSAHTFDADAPITREQICKMMDLYCSVQSISLVKDKEDIAFSDAELISDWARPYVTACRQAGLINGKENNRFDPKGKATRAEVATILYNFCIQYNEL